MNIQLLKHRSTIHVSGLGPFFPTFLYDPNYTVQRQYCTCSCDHDSRLLFTWLCTTLRKASVAQVTGADRSNYSSNSSLHHWVMPSEPSWFPAALTLAGFYISLLVVVSEFLSLLPLLPVHIPPILLHTFSLSPWKRFHSSHVFLETLQQKINK